MTAEERDREDAWLRRMLDREDATGFYVETAGNMPYPGDKEFPIPSTTGMTIEERKVVLDRWRAEVRAYLEEVRCEKLAGPAAHGAPLANPAPSPEVPAT